MGVILKITLLAFAVSLLGAGIAFLLENSIPGLTALAIAGAIAGFILGLLVWRYEPSITILLVFSLLCGFLAAVVYTLTKIYVYAIGLEAAGTATIGETIMMMIGSGVLLVMLVMNGIVAALVSAMGAALALLVRGIRY